MEAALKEQSQYADLDRRRDLEIFGLLKPQSAELAGFPMPMCNEDFRVFETRQRVRSDSLPHWM